MELLLKNSWHPNWVHEWEFVPNGTPLSSPVAPIAAICSYLVVIFGIQALMRSRKPLDDWVRPLLVLHNAGLALLSLWMWSSNVWSALHLIRYEDATIWGLYCDHEAKYARGALYFVSYVFYVSKYYELLDTLFTVLKKRPITFLPVFHHCLTLAICWMGFQTSTTFQWMGCVTNSLVHTVMYSYYAVRAAGLNILDPIKPYITKLQMFQFWFNLVFLFAWLGFDYAYDCNGSRITVVATITANVAFYFLFLRFYRNSYKEKAK